MDNRNNNHSYYELMKTSLTENPVAPPVPDKRRRRRVAGRSLGVGELSSMVSRGGERYRIDFDECAENSVLMEGRVAVSELGIDLAIHTGDAVEVQPACIDADVPPALTVSLLLEGRIDATLDGVALRATARADPVGQLWFHRHPARLRRRVCAGCRVRKVHVSVSAATLDRLLAGLDDPPSVRFAREWLGTDHVSRASWSPTHHTVHLAESILDTAPDAGVLQRLAMGANALALLREALGQVIDRNHAENGRPVDGRDAARAYRARRHIVSNLSADATLPTIASATGMSVSTLQRVFRNTFGQTVFEFIRSERLNAARASLCRGEITVGEAAYRAGYRSASNFSTAFRQEFGFPPSHCRGPARGRARR